MIERSRPFASGTRRCSRTSGSPGIAASIRTSKSSRPAPVTRRSECCSARCGRSNFAQIRKLLGVEPVDFVEHVQRAAYSSRPRSSSTFTTSASCSAWCGFEISVTCRISAASCTSSSVARNAAIKSGGRSRMNPTVSDSSTRRRDGSRTARIGGIERRKHFRRRQHLGVRQRVEERRFPRVRVAHERDHAERHGLPRAPPRGALPAHRFDGLLDFRHAVANAPPVGFEFLLARSARADAAAQPRKFFAASR